MSRVGHLVKTSLSALMLSSNLSAGLIVESGTGFAIPDNDPSGVSSSVVVSQNETVTDVEVTLNGLNHSWAGDLSATITNGTVTSTLFQRVGDTGGTSGDSSVFDGDYTFSDDGGDLWQEADNAGFGVTITGGDYKATGAQNSSVVLATDFSGQSSAGTWTLFMSDAADGDTGTLGSWSIQLTTSASGSSVVPEPGTMSLFALLTGFGCISFARRRRRHFADIPLP